MEIIGEEFGGFFGGETDVTIGLLG